MRTQIDIIALGGASASDVSAGPRHARKATAHMSKWPTCTMQRAGRITALSEESSNVAAPRFAGAVLSSIIPNGNTATGTSSTTRSGANVNSGEEAGAVWAESAALDSVPAYAVIRDDAPNVGNIFKTARNLCARAFFL